ncbi:MAG TPA: terpene synthase family protein [Polyangiaceae bacterium]|nr:terpene synthase family protein [Polyangiaceae bacterium]
MSTRERTTEPSQFSLDYVYPMPHFELTLEEKRQVRAVLEVLAERYALFESRAAWTHVLEVFIANCSARRRDPECLGLLCHFLYMTLYFNEARSHGVSPELLRAYLRVMRGGTSAPLHPVLRAAAEFKPKLDQYLRDAQLRGKDCDPSGFYHYLGLNLSGFALDAAASRGAPSAGETQAPDVESYAAVRLHTISALGYFHFWKLLLQVEADAELGSGALLFRCELLSARIQAMANDLASLARDNHDRSNNWVNVVAREQRLSQEAAFVRVSEEHASCVSRYSTAAQQARSAIDDTSTLDYLELIGSCTVGNLKSMRALQQRYA